jgi:hypothetical protein
MSLLSSLTSLRAEGRSGGSDLHFPSTQLSGVFSDGEPARLAVDHDDAPLLLLPASTRDLSLTLPVCGGLETRIVHYGVNDGTRRFFIQLKCLRPDLESVFIDLLQNICDRIRSGDSSVSSLRDAIEDFRDLLRNTSGVADRNKALGLFGELTVLGRTLSNGMDVVSAWTGPLRHRRDFCFAAAAIEVKASEKSDRSTVHISSLGQLSTDDVEKLFLWYLRVEEHPKAGCSIGGLVSQLEERLGGNVAEFRRRLSEAGFTPETSEAFNSFKWRVLESCAYRVAPGFPRISAESFVDGTPKGVQEVSYTCDLNCADDFKVPEDELLEQLT